jgi:tetratricopeptide (TPR) repeat protein
LAAMINCPYCGKLTDPKLESCPHCGGYMQKGGIELPRPGPAKGVPQHTCPNCRAVVHDGDIICVACGTNLLTGQKIAEERKQQVAAAAAPRVSFPWVIVGIVAALVVVAVAVGLGYFLTRDPIKQATQLGMAKKYMDAGTVLSAYLDKKPDDARAQFLMGKIQWWLKQFPKAAECFEKTAKLDPKNLDAAMLGVLTLSQGGAEGSRERQIVLLRQVTREFPANQEAWYLLALELAAKKDFAGEVDALKKVVETNQTDDPAAHKALAVALALQGDARAAEKELAAVKDAGTGDGDLSAAMGFIAGLNNNAEGAEQQLKQAMDNGTTVKAAAATRLGVLLVSQGKFDEAEPYLSQEAQTDKNNRAAQFFNALCMEAKGQNQEALREFEAMAGAQVKPGVPGQQLPYATEAALHAAQLTLAQGDAKKAGDMVEALVTGGISSPAIYTLRGRVFLAGNADDKAREAFKKAIELDATFAPAHLEIGLLHVKQQNLKDALQELGKYLELVGANTPGSRAEEVQAVVAQLQQASGKTAADEGRSVQ